jgi:hypothetical protein
MKTRRWLGILLTACIATTLGAREAGAICGIPNIYGVNTPAAPIQFVVLYSPILPFPPTGIAFIPLGAPYGDAAKDHIIAAGTSVPPKFMQVLGPPAPSPCSSCVVAPAAIVFGICIAPTFVGVYN